MRLLAKLWRYILFLPIFLYSQSGNNYQVLYEIYQAAGIQPVLDKAEKLTAQRNLTEADLNSLGYKLIEENKIKDAIQIFKMNIKVFPDSPNAYDSMGEAYMRNRNRDLAITNYNRVIELLPQSNIPDQLKKFLKQNAEAKLKYLQSENYGKKSAVITDFLGPNQMAFGKLHPQAPSQTAAWGRLVGNWECKIYAPQPNGQWVFGGRAQWAWKYILDGFGIQDVWYQEFVNLPPVSAALGRDVTGSNIRVYDSENELWNVVWFSNSNNKLSRFSAFNEGENVVMYNKESNPWRRITFYNIAQDTFSWKTESSADDGNTWQENLRIEAERVK